MAHGHPPGRAAAAAGSAALPGASPQGTTLDTFPMVCSELLHGHSHAGHCSSGQLALPSHLEGIAWCTGTAGRADGALAGPGKAKHFARASLSGLNQPFDHP